MHLKKSMMNFRVSCSKRFEKIDDLHPDMNIQVPVSIFGYFLFNCFPVLVIFIGISLP